MTFTAGNLFPTRSCFGGPESSPRQDSNPGIQHEKRTNYQLSYPSWVQYIMSVIKKSYVGWGNAKWHTLLLYKTKWWHQQNDIIARHDQWEVITWTDDLVQVNKRYLSFSLIHFGMFYDFLEDLVILNATNQTLYIYAFWRLVPMYPIFTR